MDNATSSDFETTRTFSLNGVSYRTDQETLELLRRICPDAQESGDGSAVQAVLYLGLQTGRIVQAKLAKAVSKAEAL